jgi:hypothetical protein
MKKLHKVERIAFDKNNLFLRVDGKEYKFRLADISVRLADAPADKREKYEISPAGYGIHWPLIDEDLSIDGLMSIGHKRSLRKVVRPAKNWRMSSKGSSRRGTRTKNTPNAV